jgi:predicted RNase H-like HicB family nuclease
MKIGGKVWKSKKDGLWLGEIPFLNLMVQATSKEEIPEMAKDAIELLVDDPTFSIEASVIQNALFVEANDPKKLIALILKRQRLKKQLKLDDVASHMRAKSINEYAQYEQGKHLPSLEKFEQLLKAIDPTLVAVMTLR